jgi:hypothetical protein
VLGKREEKKVNTDAVTFPFDSAEQKDDSYQSRLIDIYSIRLHLMTF